MAQQLTFDLPVRTALERSDFFVSEANATAVASLDTWPDWPDRKLLLFGPQGSGKTHLTHVWAEASGGRIVSARDLDPGSIEALAALRCVAIEDIDQIAGQPGLEQALFHLHNLTLAEGGQLMLTGTGAPASWNIALPDLKSRILGTPAVSLDLPDDALLAALMMKLFSDRQLSVQPNLLSYLMTRIDRSFSAVHTVVELLDHEALAQGSAVTRSFAAKVLDNQSLEGA